MKITLIILLAALISGCSFPGSTTQVSFSVEEIDYKGHQYLRGSNGGIIHAEHCRCKSALR